MYANIKVKGLIFFKRISNGNNANFHVFNNKIVTITMAQLHVHVTKHYHEIIQGHKFSMFLSMLNINERTLLLRINCHFDFTNIVILHIHE